MNVHANGDVYLATIAMENLFEYYIVFGAVSGGLKRVPLPIHTSPRAVSFAFEGPANIIMTSYVVPTEHPAQPGRLVVVKSPDLGFTWLPAETIAVPNEHIIRLRLHRSGDGALHVLWSGASDSLHHLLLRSTGNTWTSLVAPQPTSPLMTWVSGLDRCGQLTLAIQVFTDSERSDFEMARWQSRWSPFQETFTGFLGINLFDGLGYESQWYIGWSGDTSAERGRDKLKAWLTTP